tara:strand:+ start:108 stop:320 length:213 start_codon:yes stop_codon:yes gene_type:complete
MNGPYVYPLFWKTNNQVITELEYEKNLYGSELDGMMDLEENLRDIISDKNKEILILKKELEIWKRKLKNH